MRRLLCVRRLVPLDRADEYLTSWAAARSAVEAAGGRAWIFRGASHEDRFMEFVEWTDDAGPPLDDPAVSEAMEQLAYYASPLSSEEWEETS
jgi:hypothetical protein